MVPFRRQVYSNSSTGLEKYAQGVRNTSPSPTFEDGVNYSDKGIEDRVSSKI
jgi:hypothetical protein